MALLCVTICITLRKWVASMSIFDVIEATYITYKDAMSLNWFMASLLSWWSGKQCDDHLVTHLHRLLTSSSSQGLASLRGPLGSDLVA